MNEGETTRWYRVGRFLGMLAIRVAFGIPLYIVLVEALEWHWLSWRALALSYVVYGSMCGLFPDSPRRLTINGD